MPKSSTLTVQAVVTGTTEVSGSTFFPGTRALTTTITNAKRDYASGSGGASTIDLVAYVRNTIIPGSPSTPVTHDLESVTDFNGDSVDFAHVRVMAKQLVSGPAGASVIVGDSGADAFEDAYMNGTSPANVVPLEGMFLLTNPSGANGWAVTTNETDVKHDAGTFASTNVVFESLYAGND